MCSCTAISLIYGLPYKYKLLKTFIKCVAQHLGTRLILTNFLLIIVSISKLKSEALLNNLPAYMW